MQFPSLGRVARLQPHVTVKGLIKDWSLHFDENFCPATTGAEDVDFLFGLPQMAQAKGVMQVSSATATSLLKEKQRTV